MIASSLQKGSSHAANVLKLDATVQVQYLSLTIYLLDPFVFSELFAKTMPIEIAIETCYLSTAINKKNYLTKWYVMQFRAAYCRVSALVRNQSTHG